MGYPALELENIQRELAGVIRGFIRGMCLLGGEAATDMRDEFLSLAVGSCTGNGSNRSHHHSVLEPRGIYIKKGQF